MTVGVKKAGEEIPDQMFCQAGITYTQIRGEDCFTSGLSLSLFLRCKDEIREKDKHSKTDSEGEEGNILCICTAQRFKA